MSPANLPSRTSEIAVFLFEGNGKGGTIQPRTRRSMAGKHRVGRDLGEELVAVSWFPLAVINREIALLFRGEAMPPPDR